MGDPTLKVTCKTDLANQFPRQCKTAYFHNGSTDVLHEVEITSWDIKTVAGGDEERMHRDKTKFRLVLIKKIRNNPACDSKSDIGIPVGVGPDGATNDGAPSARAVCRAGLTYYSTTVTNVEFYKKQDGYGVKTPS